MCDHCDATRHSVKNIENHLFVTHGIGSGRSKTREPEFSAPKMKTAEEADDDRPIWGYKVNGEPLYGPPPRKNVLLKSSVKIGHYCDECGEKIECPVCNAPPEPEPKEPRDYKAIAEKAAKAPIRGISLLLWFIFAKIGKKVGKALIFLIIIFGMSMWLTINSLVYVIAWGNSQDTSGFKNFYKDVIEYAMLKGDYDELYKMIMMSIFIHVAVLMVIDHMFFNFVFS
jgi:hypothetical protein